MPLLPDDSETCVNDLENTLKVRGIQLKRPNETCDVVFCFCGIRLHPLSCPDAFSVNENGELVGDKTVRRGNAQGFNLSALRKLPDVKSIDRKTSLLHFIVEQVAQKEEEKL
ncbi:hypothetical protein AHAS_Ahas19G0134600 [Arachis hypogaea]